jgi:hypothetical protein
MPATLGRARLTDFRRGRQAKTTGVAVAGMAFIEICCSQAQCVHRPSHVRTVDRCHMTRVKDVRRVLTAMTVGEGASRNRVVAVSRPPR